MSKVELIWEDNNRLTFKRNGCDAEFILDGDSMLNCLDVEIEKLQVEILPWKVATIHQLINNTTDTCYNPLLVLYPLILRLHRCQSLRCAMKGWQLLPGQITNYK